MSDGVELSFYNATDGTFHIQPRAPDTDIPEILHCITFNGVWAGVIVVVLFAMIAFSTKQQRRGPAFYILTTAFLLVIVNVILKIYWAYFHMRSIFIMPEDSLDQWLDYYLHACTFVIERWITFIADSALVFKILTFLPKPTYSDKIRALVIWPMIVLLVTRLGLLCGYSAQLRSWEAWEYPDNMVDAFDTVFQLIYCTYGSAILFREAYRFYAQSASTMDSKLRRKIRFFIEGILFTYFIPVSFQVCLIVEGFYTDMPTGHSHMGVYSGMNAYTTTLFSLLATSWSTIRDKHDTDRAKGTVPGQISFDIRPTLLGQVYTHHAPVDEERNDQAHQASMNFGGLSRAQEEQHSSQETTREDSAVTEKYKTDSAEAVDEKGK